MQKRHIRFRVAQWLLNNHHFLTLKDSEKIYIYGNGVYEPKGEEIIVESIRRALGEECTTYDRNEVRAIVRDETLTDRKVFNHEEPKVCLENGIINVVTLEFEEHSPTEFFLTKIPVEYDPEAKCPRIEKFLTQIASESDVQTLKEIPGYCLLRKYPFHKAFMFVGDGANGKSTYLNLLKTFLGPENVSSISLQQLGRSRFATSALVEKLANIYPDIPDQTLTNTGTFKMLVGGDPIGAEFKFGNHFTFENHAKLLFSTNKIPETKDDTTAFFRRWVIIVFPNIFTNSSNPKADTKILEKLTAPEELSGFLNEALRALSKLLDRGKFHGDRPTSEWREDYIRKSDPIGAFVMDCLKEINNRDVFITKAKLYQEFVKYCKEKKLPVVDNVVFSRKIKAHLELAQDSTAEIRDKLGVKKTRVWRNLRLKTEKEREQEQEEEKESGDERIDDWFSE